MSSMHDSPTTREPITAACVIDGTDFCLTHQATHLNTATCLGAPVGFEADCGQPAPVARHRKRQERLDAAAETIVYVSTAGTLFALGLLVGGQVLAR